MDEIEVAWAAGFLEGEGSFHRWRTRPDNVKDYYYGRIKVSQTDLEPLERLQALFGGTIHSDRGKNEKRPDHYKPIWYWACTGRPARAAMELIYPHMTERRKAQIAVALGQL